MKKSDCRLHKTKLGSKSKEYCFITKNTFAVYSDP